MQRRFDIDLSNERLVTSYNPTLTTTAALSPLTPWDPQTITALKDELNIDLIANVVPMDPEFSPEPTEVQE